MHETAVGEVHARDVAFPHLCELIRTSLPHPQAADKSRRSNCQAIHGDTCSNICLLYQADNQIYVHLA